MQLKSYPKNAAEPDLGQKRKAIEPKENKKRSQSEPAAESSEKRVRAVPSVKSEPEPKAKAKAKAKSKPRDSSGSVEVARIKLPTNTTREFWEEQSAKEIRNQLALMGVSSNLYLFKQKKQNIATLINAIQSKK